jgi:hypothetical protein
MGVTYSYETVALSPAPVFANFQRLNFSVAIEPVVEQRDYLVGSLAQTDVVNGTPLRACAEVGRPNDVRWLLGERSQLQSPVWLQSIDRAVAGVTTRGHRDTNGPLGEAWLGIAADFSSRTRFAWLGSR